MTTAKITNETYVIAMKSGYSFFDCVRALGREPVDAPDEDRREDGAQHRPDGDELHDAFHRRCFPDPLHAADPIPTSAPGVRRSRRALCASLRYAGWATSAATACTDSHEIRAPMRVCGPRHAVHSSECGRGPLCRSAPTVARAGVCDTRGRPRGGAARGRLGRWHSRGLGGRPAQGRAQDGGARRRAPLACGRAAPRSPRPRRPTRSSRRASRSAAPTRCSAPGTTAAASRSWCSTRPSARPAA